MYDPSKIGQCLECEKKFHSEKFQIFCCDECRDKYNDEMLEVMGLTTQSEEK